MFAGAPQAKNPDGQTGIALHLDAGPARGQEFNLGGGNLVAHDDDLNPVIPEFNAIKASNFNAARARIFYYMIWAHNYDGDTSSGNAFDIPNDSFVVTLGSWPDSRHVRRNVGTFIHEFGTTLASCMAGTERQLQAQLPQRHGLRVPDHRSPENGIDAADTSDTPPRSCPPSTRHG